MSRKILLPIAVFAVGAWGILSASSQTRPATGPATQPVTRPTTVPASRPATKPASQPATRPATQPIVVSPVYYVRDIAPLFEHLGCATAACHGAAGGKGGLKLSLFSGEPEDDCTAIVQGDKGRRIDKANPAKSLLLAKLQDPSHAGRQFVNPKSPQAEMIETWIAHGAPLDNPNVAHLVSVQLTGQKPILDKGQALQLAATATFSDGTKRDVTALTTFRATDPRVVVVTPGGKVTAGDFGLSHVIGTYARHPAVERIVVPHRPAAPLPEMPIRNQIDKLVFAQCAELGVAPSGLCSDEEFLRRVYLDTTGLLPTVDQARAFLADKAPDKRVKLIDKLLDSGPFVDFQALKWGDLLRIKSEYPVNLWPNAVQAYSQWVRQSIANNKPYDQFARELLTATGSDFRDPPVNYFRALPKKDPQLLAEATGVVFMGIRMECARCHGHPTEAWTADDNLGMAAFFSQVKYKATLEWKEEIVYLSPDQVLRNPKTKKPVAPKFLDGAAPDLAKDEDPRVKFATWLTSPQNPYFARNAANRVWYWLMGRGIVSEVDDMRPTNPPSNPQLLAYLEGELAGHKFDMKHLFRLILNSGTYQASSKFAAVGDISGDSRLEDVCFSRYRLHRLGAEALLDAIGAVTETSEPYRSSIPEPYTVLPDGFLATQLFDGSISCPFLELFGRPPRDTPYESDRDLASSMRQALHMVNSQQVESRVGKSPRIARWIKDKASDEQVAEELYLVALSRMPTDKEKQTLAQYLAKDPKNRAQGLRDVVWAVLNTKEFLFNH